MVDREQDRRVTARREPSRDRRAAAAPPRRASTAGAPSDDRRPADRRRVVAGLRLAARAALVRRGSAARRSLVVILALVVMIFLHELGHFLTAKRAGMKVTEFFLGFGPRIWSFQPGRDRVRHQGHPGRRLRADHRDEQPRGGRRPRTRPAPTASSRYRRRISRRGRRLGHALPHRPRADLRRRWSSSASRRHARQPSAAPSGWIVGTVDRRQRRAPHAGLQAGRPDRRRSTASRHRQLRRRRAPCVREPARARPVDVRRRARRRRAPVTRRRSATVDRERRPARSAVLGVGRRGVPDVERVDPVDGRRPARSREFGTSRRHARRLGAFFVAVGHRRLRRQVVDAGTTTPPSSGDAAGDQRRRRAASRPTTRLMSIVGVVRDRQRSRRDGAASTFLAAASR